VFLDSKGGIVIGDHSALAEFVIIFTHNHSESRHAERSYAPVTVEDYCKIYTRAMLLPGVTVRRQAIVGACAVVSHDVPENTLVAGAPAKPLRQRKNDGLTGKALEHVWLVPGAFEEK
ncbi:MAG TPA: acyltransferase, partial [Elusimicrobiales bacterium]|nr:acyltransferase [Elusimicrobiales bacterium]